MAPSLPELVERRIDCPYCGERISVLVDGSLDEQDYIEDCQVCCRPIVFAVSIGYEDEIDVAVRTENE